MFVFFENWLNMQANIQEMKKKTHYLWLNLNFCPILVLIGEGDLNAQAHKTHQQDYSNGISILVVTNYNKKRWPKSQLNALQVQLGVYSIYHKGMLRPKFVDEREHLLMTKRKG